MTGKKKPPAAAEGGMNRWHVNYTMTEAEAMQTARENTTYIEQLGYLDTKI
ncbi:hypothetical protein MASR1M66_01620 [Aminivibrio sp.]